VEKKGEKEKNRGAHGVKKQPQKRGSGEANQDVLTILPCRRKGEKGSKEHDRDTRIDGVRKNLIGMKRILGGEQEERRGGSGPFTQSIIPKGQGGTTEKILFKTA